MYALVERLLARYGRVRAIAQAHPADLTRVTGIGPATATRMAAAFELARRVGSGTEQRDVITSAYDIAVAVWPLLRGCTRERVVVVICNRVNRVLGHEILSIGSAVKALLPIREAIAAVLRRDGHSFALAHNHPSGDPTPSAYDMRATGQVERAADATGLRLISHVVVTDHAWRTVFTPLAGRDGARVEGGDLP